MNFKITWRSAAILIVALVAGGIIGALFDNRLAGLGIVLIAVWRLADDQRRRKP